MPTKKPKETPYERRQRKRKEFNAANEYARAHKAERSFGATLRRYARKINEITQFFTDPATGFVLPERQAAYRYAMARYSEGSEPWARAAVARMLAEVDQRNKTAWLRHSAAIGAGLQQELISAPIGETVAILMRYQVGLIKSLPLEMAARVQEISLHGMTMGARPAEQEEEIEAALEKAHPQASQRWIMNRATLIARTETARAASTLTQARAEHVGATHYIWKTAGDINVRESHRRLANTTQAWDEPPLSDPPDHHSHPGQIWNCRCLALPIITG